MDIMKKNPKGGRPPKSASEKLKERLTVKMAARDYYAPARQGAGGRSHLGRIRPDGALKERRPPAPHGRTDDPALRQLAGMANNLNQLARKANSAGYVQAAAECTALIEKIDTLIDQINE